MIRHFILLVLMSSILSCKQQPAQETIEKPIPKKVNNFALVIHGGAGNQSRENISTTTDSLVRLTLNAALAKGYAVLKNGGSSLDAVEQTIMHLEDSPLFNAGKGAVYTNEETNELDASIMIGTNLDAGAVAGVTTVKNPIIAARKVMENSPHVMLSGAGADAFAKSQGLEIVDPSYYYTEKRFRYIKFVKAREQKQTSYQTIKDSKKILHKFGTVGCVALDSQGNISAGTSTGGMTNKKWNRIGDSPIIGAGTYADNNSCGISSTGHGEYFIRAAVAHDISARMNYNNQSLPEAAKSVIQEKLVKMQGEGGIIGIDKNGLIHMEFNTSGMYRASINEEGETYIAIYKDE